METENTVGAATSNPNAWLNRHAQNVTSQYGEDGILEKALALLPATDKWCVEFGPHDGQTYSNSAHLIANQSYRAVLIEPNARRFASLTARHTGNSRVVCLQKMVGFGDSDNLDAILDPVGVPIDFDLLSIDIDGNDYHAWETVKRYQPKMVVIEFNPRIPTEIDFVRPCDHKIKHGSSLFSICRLGKSKGYELICVTQINAIFERPSTSRHSESPIIRRSRCGWIRAKSRIFSRATTAPFFFAAIAT